MVAIWNGRVAGAMKANPDIGYIASLDEVVVALFIARGNVTTLTREMFLSIREQIEPTIAAISSVLISTTVLLAAIAYVMQSRREPA